MNGQVPPLHPVDRHCKSATIEIVLPNPSPELYALLTGTEPMSDDTPNPEDPYNTARTVLRRENLDRTTRKWDTPAKAYDVSGNHKRRARTRPLPGPASTARHSVYARMYRYLTGETRTYARIPVTAVAELWRNGSPEVRRILIDTFGTDRVWCALEVAEHGYRQTNGSGIPITPPDADHDHNRLIDRFTDA